MPRPAGPVSAPGAGPLPPFPGGVGLSGLRVYPWQAADGLHGGSPHLHLACAEAYVVVGGRGRLQTLVPGGLEEHPLAAGDVVWSTPGTIHRAVDDDALRVVVVMQNGGLPEAGDAVLTLPPEHLVDRAAYERATSLVPEGGGAPSPERARARRDLAVAGFRELVERTAAGDGGALERFHAAAAALVRPLVAGWEERWRAGALAEAERTGELLAALAAGDHRHLREGRASRLSPPPQEALGMCGHLVPYDVLRSS